MLSDWDLGGSGRSTCMRPPPRTISEKLLEKMKVVDFVGHLQNPVMRHDLPRSEVFRLTAPLRNARLAAGAPSGKGCARMVEVSV